MDRWSSCLHQAQLFESCAGSHSHCRPPQFSSCHLAREAALLLLIALFQVQISPKTGSVKGGYGSQHGQNMCLLSFFECFHCIYDAIIWLTIPSKLAISKESATTLLCLSILLYVCSLSMSFFPWYLHISEYE